MINIAGINTQARERINVRLAEHSLYEYTKQAWHIVEPKTPFVDNWHIRLLCDYLQVVAKKIPINESYRHRFEGLSDGGMIDYLLLNFPPRCMKSLLVSVMLVTWHWIDNPEDRLLCSASNADLSMRDSLKCRDIIQSDWYQARWGARWKMSIDQNAKKIFKNSKQGERRACSVEGKVTGQGGDILIGDDLNDMGEIYSQASRNAVLHFWNVSFSTRENPEGARKILMQQRGHEKDIAGDAISKEKEIRLTKLIIKAIATEQENFYSPLTGELVFSRPCGGLMWPELMGHAFLEKRKAQLRNDFEAQYQQAPKVETGNIINTSRILRLNDDPKAIQTIISIDTAFKTGAMNDYSVAMVWFRFIVDDLECYFLKGILKGKFEYPELKEKLGEYAKRYKPNKILIEDKASGQSLIQDLKKDAYFKPLLLPIQVDKDKITRAYAITDLIEQGRVYIPASCHWEGDLLNELSMFPNSEHDDQVDAFTQGLRYLSAKATVPGFRVL